MTGSPAAHVSMRQPCVPGVPPGQLSVHVEPASHSTWQLWSAHVKLQWLSGPQWQVPFEHVPSQSALSPAQSTWHGPFEQRKSQLPPRAQLQSPFAHVPLHESPLQST